MTPRSPVIRRSLQCLAVLTVLALFGCATAGQPEGDVPADREAEAEPRISETLPVEPVTPADGAPVTTLPVSIELRVIPEETTQEDAAQIAMESLTFTLYRGSDAAAGAQIYESVDEEIETIPVPSRLLEDGTTYAYRLSDGAGRRSEVYTFRLAIDAPVPELTAPRASSRTFDRTPTLRVASSASRHEFQLAENREALGQAEVIEGDGSVTVDDPLDFGSRYAWRARSVLESGARGVWSEASTFTVSRDFVVEAETVGFGLPTVSLTPYVGVSSIPGASIYRFEIVAGEVALDDSAWASPLVRAERPTSGFSLGEAGERGSAATGDDAGNPGAPDAAAADAGVQAGPALSEGERYSLRVEVANDTGDLLGWFGPFVFEGGTLELPFVPVLTTGERAEFNLTRDAPGIPGGVPADVDGELRVARTVALTRPFAMAVTETTNAQFARIMNWALASGRARVEGDRVVAGSRGVAAVGEEEGRQEDSQQNAAQNAAQNEAQNAQPEPEQVTLLFLGDLFIGAQLGLELVADDADAPRLAVVDGRAAHPVVGVTWYGAQAFADYYGILTGARDYRLPTEAEWVYSATGGGARTYPWGAGLSGNRANYFRSGDPFEAVTPPYSAGGGPTTPAGYYNGTIRDGYQTLSNASPAGVFDLMGNVWEWCLDWYALGHPGASPDAAIVEDPRGPETPEPDEFGVVHRVVRGVGWNTRRGDVAPENRGRFDPGEGSYATGFRLVRDLAPPRDGE